MKIKNLNRFQKFKNIVNECLLNMKEVVKIATKDPENTEAIINRNQKVPFTPDRLNELSSLIIKDNLMENKSIRKWSDYFSKAHPDIHYAHRDVHIYYSPTIHAATFKEHMDNSINFIVQCEGYSRWTVHGIEMLLEPQDVLYIPCRTTHRCIPLSRRLSLSFAYWRD